MKNLGMATVPIKDELKPKYLQKADREDLLQAPKGALFAGNET